MDPSALSIGDTIGRVKPAADPQEGCPQCAGTGYTTHVYRVGQQLETLLLGADDLADLVRRTVRRAQDAANRALELRSRHLEGQADACEVESQTLRVCALAMRSVLMRQGPPDPPPGFLGRVARLWSSAGRAA